MRKKMAIKQQEKKPLHLAKLNIKKGDSVLILTGKDKGKQGTVSRAMPQANKVVVEGLNMVKKHVKPQAGSQTRQGGVIDKAMPLHVSNTMLICSECGKPTRVAHERRVINDKERSVRVCKQCHKVIADRSRKD
jgi:large subunit ribosomal protein L24